MPPKAHNIGGSIKTRAQPHALSMKKEMLVYLRLIHLLVFGNGEISGYHPSLHGQLRSPVWDELMSGDSDVTQVRILGVTSVGSGQRCLTEI